MRPTDVRTTITVVVLLFGSLATWAAERPRDESQQAWPRWTLATADTRLVIGVGTDQRLSIQELSSPAGWNWTASSSPFPLLSRADVEGTPRTLDWVYRQGTEDNTDGTKVTLSFAHADPALELTSVWHARSGPGPVRHTMFIKNKSEKQVTIYQQESLDLQIVAPSEDTRVCYVNDDGSLPDATGVYRDPLRSGYQKTLHFSEDQDFIPYTLVDARGEHGVYIGWEWSIGRIAIAASAQPGGVSLKAGNGDGFQTDLAAGETFEVPGHLLQGIGGERQVLAVV